MRHFNVSLIVWAKSQDSVHKPQFLKRNESRSGSIRGPSAYQPSALPLGYTGSQNPTDTHSETYAVRAGRKESKQTVQSIRSSKQPNQQNLCFLGSLQLQISLQLHNQLSQIKYQIKA